MEHVFVGSEALRDGVLTRSSLRWNCAAMFPDVYASRSAQLGLPERTVGGWLWSRRRAVVAGRAAAALHGALWVDANTPIELISPVTRPPTGIITRHEKIADDEITVIGGLLVTTAQRTAFDLARHHDRDVAVRHLDALACGTAIDLRAVAALAERYPRARGLRRGEVALALTDGGAQSPRETDLRLLLIDEGFPRPRTQIHISDGHTEAYLDMGWDGPKIGVDYDGAEHQRSRTRFVHDIGRNEFVRGQGWHDIHVVKEHRRKFIVHRVNAAFEDRGHALRLRSGS